MKDLQKAQYILNSPNYSLKELAEKIDIKYQTLRRYSANPSELENASAKTVNELAKLWDQSPTFNLLKEPWIKVLDNEFNEQRVSMEQLFKNAANYRMLAGDMKIQDLAVLRFLLSIIITVYSRFDEEGHTYDWLKANRLTKRLTKFDEKSVDENTLLTTWHNLYQNKAFSQSLYDYLNANKNHWDLFGDAPFFQANADIYNSNVTADKVIGTDKGTVPIRTINRTISESGNSLSIFTPRSKAFKDQIKFDELARWIITYHSYSTVSEKNLVALDGKKTKFQKSAGWLYRLSPCFVTGKNLFETLMLNTVLVGDKGAEPQKPYWEYNQQDYIEHRLQMKQPENTAEAYSVWSRMLHIDLDAYGKPILYSASFPQLKTKEAYSEQMTTWRFNQKQGGMTPDLKREANIEEPMWLDWNEFTDENTDNTHALGTMEWLKLIYQQGWISKDSPINLTTINLIDNGNMTSKLPIRELYNRISPKLWMLSDKNWFRTIGLIVDATAKVAGSAWKLSQEVSNLKGLQAQSNAIAQKTKNKFWRDLADSMISFDDWLEEIEYSDDRVEVARNWFTITAKTYDSIRAEICSDPSPREIKGDNDQNIFTINNHYRGSVQRTIVNALTEIKKIS